MGERTLPARAAWLARAMDSGMSAMPSFATGLQRDQAAVAAVRLPGSTAHVEGQITRLKLINRQMDGRANFDLLRQRVLQAA
jgi:transposase